ncbi:MAG: hypothetical protein M3Q31_05535 [Actinomycetota bacterium]|nr:hypothetical protein [Actinomycetota bacterium]
MIRFDAAAEDRRRVNLEAHATPSERIRLIAEQDAGVILVRMAFGGDMLVRTDGAPVEAVALEDLGPNPTETARAIAERIRLRIELGLKSRDCNALRQREGCTCLQEAIDRLLEVDGVNKKRVVSLAKDLHKKQVAELQAQAKEADLRAQSAQEAQESKQPVATPQTATVKRPGSSRRPRRRAERERPDPLSWSEFKRGQSGHSIRDVIDGKF